VLKKEIFFIKSDHGNIFYKSRAVIDRADLFVIIHFVIFLDGKCHVKAVGRGRGSQKMLSSLSREKGSCLI